LDYSLGVSVSSKIKKDLEGFEKKIDEFSKEYMGVDSGEMTRGDWDWSVGIGPYSEESGFDRDNWPAKHYQAGKDIKGWETLLKASAVLGDKTYNPEGMGFLSDKTDYYRGEGDELNITDVIKSATRMRADYRDEFRTLPTRDTMRHIKKKAYLDTHPQLSLKEHQDYYGTDKSHYGSLEYGRWMEESPEEARTAYETERSRYEKFWDYMGNNPEISARENAYNLKSKAVRKLMKEYEKGALIKEYEKGGL
tara:strand:+ start:958 stop:1710 length:753 start_codon:yes stop_codon:yes gene_type:complete